MFPIDSLPSTLSLVNWGFPTQVPSCFSHQAQSVACSSLDKVDTMSIAISRRRLKSAIVQSSSIVRSAPDKVSVHVYNYRHASTFVPLDLETATSRFEIGIDSACEVRRLYIDWSCLWWYERFSSHVLVLITECPDGSTTFQLLASSTQDSCTRYVHR